MRLAVSSTGSDLDSQIDPRFGRCAYFLIVETDDMSVEVFKNASAVLGGGAGIQSAQFIASKGAKAVITGRCGPNAVQALSATGLEVYVDHAGIIKDVLKKFLEGGFTPTLQPNAADHSGMRDQAPSEGTGAGTGMGGGGGRGMGGGGGRGMGGGGGKGMGGGGGRGMGGGGGKGMGGGGGRGMGGGIGQPPRK